MVENEHKDGKNSDMTGMALQVPIWVVAGALRSSRDSWLMHRRPLEKFHGGLWEFPGGKVEGAEIPVKALIRELHEELSIEVRPEDCKPAGFAEEIVTEVGLNTRPPIVILLYTIGTWVGEPRSLEGGRIGWFGQEEIKKLDKPPLDQKLAIGLFSDS